MAYQYGYINIKNLDNTSKISNFALMKNFAAIDFETANQQRTSVCSVGIVIVRDGEIVDSYYSLIKPEPEYFQVDSKILLKNENNKVFSGFFDICMRFGKTDSATIAMEGSFSSLEGLYLKMMIFL